MAAPLPESLPRRARRVGDVPVPRIRPLAEVLGQPPGGPVVVDDTLLASPHARDAQEGLDRLADTLRPVVARLLGAVVEVLAGRRPPAHLGTLLTPAALTTLARAAPARPVTRRREADGAAAPAPRPVLRGLRVCAVSERAVEVCAVVDRRDRARALAARLERVAGTDRWHVVALCVG